MSIKQFIKKITPQIVFSFYHYILAVLASIYYRYPSNKMVVIGVTGTNGKTTVVHLISAILEEAGHKVGRISSIDFKVGGNVWRNSLKMTMPGRFYLQKLLKGMVKAGCDYAVLEVTSEGIKQFRHKGINFDIGVFTNLTPEHIESHGSFENYKKAKLNFFEHLSKCKRKNIKDPAPLKLRRAGKKIEKVLVINGDDKYAEEFLNFKVDEKYIYKFDERDIDLNLRLPGKFNVYNALAAMKVARSQGIEDDIIKEALEEVKNIPGRLEFVDEGQQFMIVVDYAHTPDALHKVYETLCNASSKFQVPSSKLICVLGATGGGRDKWKRPELGKIAAEYCDEIILTDEDPYSENPEKILNDIFSGFSQVLSSKFQVSRIIDRREAIRKALSLAKPNDAVIITGKGAENKMMVKGGPVPWDDRDVAREELNRLKING